MPSAVLLMSLSPAEKEIFKIAKKLCKNRLTIILYGITIKGKIRERKSPEIGRRYNI